MTVSTSLFCQLYQLNSGNVVLDMNICTSEAVLTFAPSIRAVVDLDKYALASRRRSKYDVWTDGWTAFPLRLYVSALIEAVRIGSVSIVNLQDGDSRIC